MASRGSHHCRVRASLKEVALRQLRAGFKPRPLLSASRSRVTEWAAFNVSGTITVLACTRARSWDWTKLNTHLKKKKQQCWQIKPGGFSHSWPRGWGSAPLSWRLTSTTLQKAGCTSVRLKQWDEERRRCALFWLWGSLRVYPSGGLRLADIGCRRLLGESNWILRASVTLLAPLVVRREWRAMALKLNGRERTRSEATKRQMLQGGRAWRKDLNDRHLCKRDGIYIESHFVFMCKSRLLQITAIWINVLLNQHYLITIPFNNLSHEYLC